MALDRRTDAPPPTAEAAAPVFDVLLDETRRRVADVNLERPSQVSDAELWVDPDTWAEVVDRVAAAMVDLHDAARPAGTAGTVRTSTSVVMVALAVRAVSDDTPNDITGDITDDAQPDPGAASDDDAGATP